MIKLSDRLQIIADRLKDSKTMADIGTDHGFLPIYLIQSESCSKVIFADISLPSLKKAEENCNKYLTEGYELRAGDGLKVLKSGETDAVVIAGMGGKLMIEIMDADFEHTISFRKFILQPRTAQGPLIKWLLEKGFVIEGEDLCEEGDYIPEILTVVSPGWEHSLEALKYEDYDFGVPTDEKDIRFKVPPWIVDCGSWAGEFIRRNLQKERNVLENLSKSKNPDEDAKKRFQDSIKYLEELLRRCEDEK